MAVVYWNRIFPEEGNTIRTLILTVCSLLLWSFPGFGESESPQREEWAVGFETSIPDWIVPAMANTGGRSGAFFKTRVVIHNHTPSSYFVHALLFGAEGFVDSATIPLEPNASRIWDNFLGDVFDYSSNGAVVFYSFGLDDPNQDCIIGSDDPIAEIGDCGSPRFFSVTAETYTDSPGGRIKTMVVNGVPGQSPLAMGLDFLNGILEGLAGGGADIPDSDFPFGFPDLMPPAPANTGISVSETERTNLGVFNFTGAAVSIQAEVMDTSGNLVEVVDFGMVPKWSWHQKAITGPVENGVVQWNVQDAAPVHLWAVTVDNRSNDGSFFPAIRMFEASGWTTPLPEN